MVLSLGETPVSDNVSRQKKRALGLIYSANRQHHAIPLFVKAKVLLLNFLKPS